MRTTDLSTEHGKAAKIDVSCFPLTTHVRSRAEIVSIRVLVNVEDVRSRRRQV